jgi:hypothetical protein
MESDMALTPAERERLSDRLTIMLHNLVDRPDNITFKRALETNNVHVTDVRVSVGEPKLGDIHERWVRENAIMERHLQLIRKVSSHVKWDDFVFACSEKIDVTGQWRATIAQAIGVDAVSMQFRQSYGQVPLQWVEKVNALPDWKPTPRRRSNFAQIASELVRRLRHSGMSRHEIAGAFNDFLRDFNGTRVTASDITASLD